jgi:hypothetical protein
VPLTQISKEKLPLLFPTLLPASRREKQSRKPESAYSSASFSAYGSASPSPLTMSSSSPSPSSSTFSTDADFLVEGKPDFCKMDEDEGIGNCERKRARRVSCSSSISPFQEELEDEDDWMMDLLKDELLHMT